MVICSHVAVTVPSRLPPINCLRSGLLAAFEILLRVFEKGPLVLALTDSAVWARFGIIPMRLKH